MRYKDGIQGKGCVVYAMGDDRYKDGIQGKGYVVYAMGDDRRDSNIVCSKIFYFFLSVGVGGFKYEFHVFSKKQ